MIVLSDYGQSVRIAGQRTKEGDLTCFLILEDSEASPGDEIRVKLSEGELSKLLRFLARQPKIVTKDEAEIIPEPMVPEAEPEVVGEIVSPDPVALPDAPVPAPQESVPGDIFPKR